MTSEVANQLRQRVEAELQRLDAEIAMEAPALIAKLLAKNTTPFDDYITTEQLWQRFNAALIRDDIRDVNNNLCHMDDFMLIDVSDSGRAAFKNYTTRQYAYLEPDNTLIAKGTYFHWPQPNRLLKTE